jgi:hypothetical protein
MTSKINITQIVRDHVATLKNEGTGKFSFFDIVIFVVLPFALALIYYAFGWTFSENATSRVVTGMSIFAGLMINVLVLIYTVALNTKYFGRDGGRSLRRAQVFARNFCQHFVFNSHLRIYCNYCKFYFFLPEKKPKAFCRLLPYSCSVTSFSHS